MDERDERGKEGEGDEWDQWEDREDWEEGEERGEGDKGDKDDFYHLDSHQFRQFTQKFTILGETKNGQNRHTNCHQMW